ncbi:MAG: cation:proton antiporter, partial [Spirochaetota bacterium]
FGVGLLLILGFFLAKLTEKINLPPIGGYILAGLLLGDSLLGLVHYEVVQSFKVVTELAVGILAITIGSEFSLIKLKREGIKIIIISIFMIIFTFAIMFSLLILFNMSIIFAMILSLIACTTAPAITLTVIKTLRVRGVFVDYVYGIVSISDSIMFLIYGIVIAVIGYITNLDIDVFSWFDHILMPFTYIIISALLGSLIGFILHIIIQNKKKQSEILIISLGTFLLSTAIAISLDLSFILVNMMFGITLINLSPKNERLFRVRVLYPLMPPIYSLFFAIAGISLDITILSDLRIVFIILLYIVIRFIGKYSGVFIGSQLVKADDNVKKYLGLCVLSQAGIAIAFTMILENTGIIENYPVIVNEIVNIILISVFLNQILGKLITRFAVIKAMDIDI